MECAKKSKNNFNILYQTLNDIKNENDTDEDLFKNNLAKSTFARIFAFGFENDRLDLINTCFNYNFCEILKKFLENNQKSLFDELRKKHELNESNELNELLALSNLYIGIVRSFSNYSIKFCKEFHEANCLSVLFKYLDDELLIENYKNNYTKDKDLFSAYNKIVRAAIGCLVNLSKVVSSYKEKWKNENACDKLLKYSESLKDIEDCQLASYMVLAKIADDDEIDNFPNLKNVLPLLTKYIGKIAKNLTSKTNLKRIKIEIDENLNNQVEVSKLLVKNVIWHLIELLEALYNMAINDNIKNLIYFQNNMKEYLKLIILNGNNVEIEYALKMLWQLSFDKNISDDVWNDKELLNKIEEFSKDFKEKQGLLKNADGILWLVNNRSVDQNEEKSDSSTEANQLKKSLSNIKAEKEKHIMISYNRESRDLCLKIKEELEKDGHKVWIDVESIHGSSLESMANAIENSKCVLMCMTEKYKQSPPCRAEAEYAFQLNKPIIPLIMQNNYKPDGWLGIILGSKIFIHFMKYEFKECIKRLRNELKNCKIETQHTKPSKEQKKDLNKNNTEIIDHHASKWNESEVENWLKSKNFNSIIINNVSPCNGIILNQLYSMQVEAPEFFYSSISSNKSIATKDIAIFAFELKNLFK